MSHSHSDFKHLGLSSCGLESWIVAIVFAYSGKWNSQNLENHIYAFWNLVLLDLVNDLAPDTIVILQFQFDTVNGAPVAPNDFIATIAQAKAKEVVPDFAIAIFHLVRCHISAMLCISPILLPAMFNHWCNIKLGQTKIPLITEVKHPATHWAKFREHFGEALKVQMGFAQADLLKQAKHAFLMQPAAKKVVLLACCGECWSWMVSMRATCVEEFILPNFLNPEKAKEPEISNTPHKIPDSTAQEHLPCDKKKSHQRNVSCPITISTLQIRKTSIQAAAKRLKGDRGRDTTNGEEE